MSEEWILVCTYSGANSCKEVGVGDYGYVCWITWAGLLSLLKKIGRQDRSDDLSHYGIQSNIKFNSITNEKSSWMKFKKPDQSLGIRSPTKKQQSFTNRSDLTFGSQRRNHGSRCSRRWCFCRLTSVVPFNEIHIVWHGCNSTWRKWKMENHAHIQLKSQLYK